jgi:hypothetical protein
MKEIEIKVQKSTTKTVLSQYSTNFNITDTTKVSDIKSEIKNKIQYPNEVLSEIVYIKNKEMKDDDLVNVDSKIEYVLTLK